MELNEAARGLIGKGADGTLVTLNPDGSPQVSLVWVALQSTPDGDELVTAHLGEHKKVRNVRNDPRVAVTIVSVEGAGKGMRPYLSVAGTARIVEGGAPEELAAWCDELAAGGPVLVVGDGAVRYVEQLAPRPGLDLGLAETVAAPSPAVLVRLAARRLAAGAPLQAATDIVPDYRRPADAKINWEERAPQRTAPPPPGDGR